jgi:hypothetical protein
VQPESTIQPEVPVKDAGSRTIHVRHRRESALGRIGEIERNGRIALRRIGRLLVVGVHKPAPGAAAHSLPIGDRAGFEVVHNDRPGLTFAPHEERD